MKTLVYKREVKKRRKNQKIINETTKYFSQTINLNGITTDIKPGVKQNKKNMNPFYLLRITMSERRVKQVYTYKE